MYVTWDPAKARANEQKHGVSFADAAIALEDENALTILDNAHGEIRFKTLAMNPESQVLFIVHSEQDDETIRIISARHADKAEERVYFEGDFYE